MHTHTYCYLSDLIPTVTDLICVVCAACAQLASESAQLKTPDPARQSPFDEPSAAHRRGWHRCNDAVSGAGSGAGVATFVRLLLSCLLSGKHRYQQYLKRDGDRGRERASKTHRQQHLHYGVATVSRIDKIIGLFCRM